MTGKFTFHTSEGKVVAAVARRARCSFGLRRPFFCGFMTLPVRHRAAVKPTASLSPLLTPRAVRRSEPHVAAVIVHYGDPELALRALAALNRSRNVVVSPLLVDNSARGSVALRRQVEAADGFYLHYPENLGFAGGANAGLRHARSRLFDALIVLNSDVEVGRRCLERLVLALDRQPSLGVVGPALYFATDPRRYWNRGSRVHWPAARPASLSHGDRRCSVDVDRFAVDFVCGALLAMRPRVFEAVGELSEDYFLYFEDADYCYRVRQRGWAVAIEPRARAWHRGGGSTSGTDVPDLYYRTRNRLFLSAAWNPLPVRGRLTRVAFLLQSSAKALRRLLSGRRREASLLWAAMRDYCLGRGGRIPSSERV